MRSFLTYTIIKRSNYVLQDIFLKREELLGGFNLFILGPPSKRKRPLFFKGLFPLSPFSKQKREGFPSLLSFKLRRIKRHPAIYKKCRSGHVACFFRHHPCGGGRDFFRFSEGVHRNFFQLGLFMFFFLKIRI